MNVIRTMIHNEGFTGLFKGVSSPIFGSAPLIGIRLATYDFCRWHLKNNDMSDFSKQFIGGFIAGIASLPIILPFDLFKIKA